MSEYQVWLDECGRLAEVAERYNQSRQSIYDDLAESVMRFEYARGGETIHRGYYCPSPVFDIITSGASRGKLLKDISKIKKKPDYQFGFDDENQLVIVQSNLGKEILLRDGDTEIGAFFTKYEIETVSECHYDKNRIQSYLYGLCLEGKVTELRKEVYEYSQEGLAFLDLYTFHYYSKQVVYGHERLRFEHKDGYLSKYKQVPCDDLLLKNRRVMCEVPFSVYDMEYDVSIKRKV